jgi:hypothetical protein
LRGLLVTWLPTRVYDEAALTEVFAQLSTRGNVLVIVDQPASIGGLAVAVASSAGYGDRR